MPRRYLFMATTFQRTQNPIYDLPLLHAGIVGRERESAVVEELLRDNTGPITLTGMAGIGKTRLALHVASRLATNFPGNTCMVDLAPLADQRLVASTIAQALGVTEQPGKALTSLLKEHLADKHLLLVLDGFERVLEAAPLIRDLLSAAPHVKALVTSRVPLGLDGEQEHRVPPLDLPAAAHSQYAGHGSLSDLLENEAVQLFVCQAQAGAPNFALNEKNAASIVAICHYLHGIPLAIELAAAQAGRSSPQETLSGLQSRGGIGINPAPTSTARNGQKSSPQAMAQTLHNVIDWSYNHLVSEEKRLFRHVGVFTGGFTLEAAELVCDVGSRVREVGEGVGLGGVTLAGLVRSNLDIGDMVNNDGIGIPTTPSPYSLLPRFLMPRAIHEYAIEKLEAGGEEAQLRRRHAVYFATLAEEAELHLRGPHVTEWLSRLDEELPNLRAALRWAESDPEDSEIAVRLSSALGLVWGITQRLSEERTQLSAMMDRAGYENETSARAAAQANALWAASMRAVAFLAWQHSDYEAARTLDEKNLRTYRKMGDNRQIALALLNLGNTASKQGDQANAQAHIEESLTFFKVVGDKAGIAESLESLAVISQEMGDLEAARTFYQESLALNRDLGYQVGVAASLLNLGEVERALGNYAEAGALYEQSLVIYRTTHNGGVATALHNLGQVALHTGEIARARELFRESLMLFHQLGFAQGVASSLAGLAGVESRNDVGAHGRAPLRAGKLLAASFAIIESTGAAWSPIDRTEYNHSLSLACVQVDSAAWQAAWNEGQAMSMDEAIEYALRDA